MMRWAIALLIVAIGLVALLGQYTFATQYDGGAALKAAQQQTDLWKARYAEEATKSVKVADTVVRTVTKVRTLRDTLNVHDTVAVREYVYQTDTLMQACERCAQQILSLRETADATQRVNLRHIEALQVELARQKRQNVLKRFGVTVGYGVTQHGGVLVVGPQVNVGIRILP